MSYWKTRHEPIVYYMVHENYRGAIKIGTTVNSVNRLDRFIKNRRNGQYFFLAWERGGPDLEAARHRKFEPYRIQGEWFFYEGELYSHVEDLMKNKFTPKYEGIDA